MSSPITGSIIACGGLLFYFGMLNLIRRPGAGPWLKSGLVRELTVFTSIIALISGLGLCAQYATMRNRPSLEWLEILGIAAAVVLTGLIIWRIRRPIPADELPEPVLGIDPDQIGSGTRPSGRARERKVA